MLFLLVGSLTRFSSRSSARPRWVRSLFRTWFSPSFSVMIRLTFHPLMCLLLFRWRHLFMMTFVVVLPPVDFSFASSSVSPVVPDSSPSRLSPLVVSSPFIRSPHVIRDSIPAVMFGSCCSSVSHPTLCKPKASSLLVSVVVMAGAKDAPRAELGVCLGYSCESTGSYDFLSANDEGVALLVQS